MANTTITALPAATTPLAGTEVVPIVQGGVTKKVAVSAISGGGSVTSVGVTSPVTNTGTSTAPVIAVNASSANTNSYLVQRDASGNFSAGTITASQYTVGANYYLTFSGSNPLQAWSATSYQSYDRTADQYNFVVNGGGVLALNTTAVQAYKPIRLQGSTSGYVGLAAPATAGSTTYTFPSADGSNGQVLKTDGSGNLSWVSSSGSGTVTSVAMSVPTFLSVTGSPITSSGTLAVTLSGTALPVANGGTGQTSANAALNGLLPSQSGQSGKVLSTNGTDTTWTAVGGTGTVTSVALSAPAFLTVSGSPITASGTLALTYSGTAIPVANGGTGQTTTTAAFDGLAPTQTGNSGKYLTTNGSTTSWATVSGGGSPAGADTQVQYNSGGTSFGASSAFTFTSSTGVVTATGFSGALNGTVGATTPTTGVFTTATARSTAVQDFVALQGRAGGTNSYGVTLTPTTLTASRTLTLPDASGTILQSGTTVTVGQGGTGATTLTGVLKGNGTSAFSAATSGTDYSAGTSALATGIVKSTTSTGALSIAVANTDYQSPITLTTVGSSGAATFVGNTLNIPVYTGGGSSGPILESYQTISSNYSLTAGSNGFSVGPVSVATGVAVTVPTGQVWLIAA